MLKQQARKHTTTAYSAVVRPRVIADSYSTDNQTRLIVREIPLKSFYARSLPELILIAKEIRNGIEIDYGIRINGKIRPLQEINSPILVGLEMDEPTKNKIAILLAARAKDKKVILKKYDDIVINIEHGLPVLKELVFTSAPLEKFSDFVLAIEDLNDKYEIRIIIVPDISLYEELRVSIWDADMGWTI